MRTVMEATVKVEMRVRISVSDPVIVLFLSRFV